MFPSGVQGAALLVLRVSVAATLLEHGTGHWILAASLWMLLPIILTATCLCLGLLTPICASLCCLIEFYSLTITGEQDMFHLVISILTSAILATLGPGAYSLDARIFGRRLLTVPHRQRHQSD
jgi:uncharacterized membrane protein YphA (DoxX/SURF4 family)